LRGAEGDEAIPETFSGAGGCHASLAITKAKKHYVDHSPLRIRGARGVTKTTPFIPLNLRGTFKKRALLLGGHSRQEIVLASGIWV